MASNVEYSWEDIEHGIQHVCDMLTAKYELTEFNGVYGIPRGGLVLAVILSHRLKLPLLGAPNESCLLVDDIVDTGLTTKHIKRKALVTICYNNHIGAERPIYAFDTHGQWAVFPWEK